MQRKIKNFIFATVAVILVLSLFEGTSRLYHWFSNEQMQRIGADVLAFKTTDLSPYVFFRKLPALELRPKNNFFYKFGDKTVSAQKEPGEYRIFILGGSVARGYGAAAPNSRFYNILEGLLQKSNPDPKTRTYKVYSAGRLGYVTAQELILLMMGVLDFNPDLVIHLNGVNDILTVTQYKERPGYPFYFESLTQALEAVKIGRKLDKTLNKSSFLTSLEAMFKKYKSSTLDLTGKNIARHYERNMRQAAQLLTSNKIPAFFFLQPLLLDKKVMTRKEKSNYNQIKSQDRQLWKNTYPKFSNALQSISKELSVSWKNMQKAFDNEKQFVFLDTVHFNDLGQRLLAEAIFNEIKHTVYNFQ